MRRRAILSALMTALMVAATSRAAAAEIREELHSIPVIDGGGHTSLLKTKFCRPRGDGPSTLVMINHGSPPNAEDRPKAQLWGCDHEMARWFLDRGYVVAFPLRRGYGATGGVWAEDYGGCNRADYFAAGLETARDIDAVARYAATLPYVRPQGEVVIGHSAGGWGTVAYASVPHDTVAALISMAGGRGGHHKMLPNDNCKPDLLVSAAGRYGAAARTPMLWVYAANDSFFAPPLAHAMWQAFTKAGGQADLEQVGAYGEDGHRLLIGPNGSAVWGPLVERYLAERHIAP